MNNSYIPLGINQIYLGDCLEGMKGIEDGSVDMILCDLPYGTTQCKWDTIIPFEPLWEHYERIIRNNGAIVLFGSQPFTSRLIGSNINNFSHQWVWDKGMGANPFLATKMPIKIFEDVCVFYFNYNSYDKRRSYFEKVLSFIGKNKAEVKKLTNQGLDHCFRFDSTQFDVPTDANYQLLIETFGIDEMDGFKPYAYIENKPRVYNAQKIVKGAPVRKGFKGKNKTDGFLGGAEQDTLSFNNEYYPTAIIHFSNKKEKKLHPTQKPVALCEYLIKTYTNPGELVLDNCIGSGTTAVAAIRTGRNFIGFEKEKPYYEVARKRILDAQLDVMPGIGEVS